LGESFFEFREKLTQRPDPPVRSADDALTVTQLTRKIDQALRQNLPASLLVKGEVSNFNAHAGSGHFYFTLKDQTACVDCVMFRSDAVRVKFKPTDGMELLATGSIKVYAQRGRYQLYVTSLQPIGQGALELAFQQLRKKLDAEGLFAAERKKPLPTYPVRIALVTAGQAAALQDMLKVLRRFRWLSLMIYPVPVQGDGAAEKIASALRHLSRRASDVGGVDVIVLGRGGGSLEDLWAFNEEVVARAIAASTIPVITGIGHEVDVSIADLVADYHAHTPTEAAQVITSNWRGAAERVEVARVRLARSLRDQLVAARSRVEGVYRHEFFRRPLDVVNRLRQRLDDHQQQMRAALNARLWKVRNDLHEFEQSLATHHPRHAVELARQRVDAIGQRLRGAMTVREKRYTSQLEGFERALRLASPESVLRRGYSMTTLKKDGSIVRSVKQVKGGERLETRLGDGTINSIAEDPKQPKLF
jgi:exodeoxyribonuclease VII large subunit